MTADYVAPDPLVPGPEMAAGSATSEPPAASVVGDTGPEDQGSARAAIIRENLLLLRLLRQLADQFQQVYESAYAPAPAAENGVYHEVRYMLAKVWGSQQFDGEAL